MTDDATAVNGSGSRIPPWLRRELCRELAVGDVKRAALARKYGVSAAAITKFAKVHAAEIDDIRASLDDAFAGLWIASKESRLAAHQADYELSAGGDFAAHYEQIRTRTAVLHAAAEELGQLPGRGGTTIVTPVVHIVEGIDVEVLT